ncbi:hypothetical protein GQ44DRAFT_766954 [Phaeosphaeriaceae sp. PMI808]|nr:hypothetical protein GQ44DRAFT_766954 [Phaeosphaeriaceae sp. PMI808]
MATSKRKRRSTRPKQQKRTKYEDSSDCEIALGDSYYKALEILDERIVRGSLQYLIQWEGIDPSTTQNWQPTWEPSNAPNEELLRSWREEKEKSKIGNQEIESQELPAVNNSPEPPTAHSSTISRPSTPDRADTIPPLPSSSPTTPTGIVPPIARTPSPPRVLIEPRGSSLNRDEYDYVSQLVTSQAAPTHSQSTSLDSSQLIALIPEYRSSGVVPDSQNSEGEESFSPGTQLTTGTTQPPSTADNSLEVATQDSELVELAQEFASCPPSPVRSIPETIADSQSQPQGLTLVSQQPIIAPDSSILSREQVQHRKNDLLHDSGLLSLANTQSGLAESSGQHHAAQSSNHTAQHQPVDFPNHSAQHLSNQSDTGGVESQSVIPKAASATDICQSPSAQVAQHPETAAHQAEIELNTNSANPTQSIEEAVEQRDFAPDSQLPQSTNQSSASRQQNAQVLPPLHDLSTRGHTVESIRPSIEKQEDLGRIEGATLSSPNSRHDSSQETPERRLSSAEHSPPIPPLPNNSTGSLGSFLPSRPQTPTSSSSLSKMATGAGESTGDKVAREIRERIAKRQAENPFIPKRRLNGSVFLPSSSVAAETPSPLTSERRLLNTGLSPSVAAAAGTRSPSTVPDRSPAPPAPTSLRTIALTHASQTSIEKTREEAASALSKDQSIKIAADNHPAIPAIGTKEPAVVVPVASSSDEEMTDASDDDTPSLLEDDLHLAPEEYIVPLFLEGRQCDMYSDHINENKEILHRFQDDPQGFEPLTQIEDILEKLRAIETHIDLLFAEAGSGFDKSALDSATQIQFAAEFGMENAIKFRFLHCLFYPLRQEEKHLVLVIQEDNDLLFNAIEIFCKHNCINYDMPTKGRRADPADLVVEDNLLISILPSTVSPIIRPVDAIICLDGVQDATEIRKKSWATNPELEVVPVLHLVIPRTVGHIERYLSPSLNDRERIQTIVASLAQMRSELGKPIDEDTPRASLAASQVAQWLALNEEGHRPGWPLVSIGSVKDVIEYQSQLTQTQTQMPASSPVPERTKRPHDHEELDSAKRIRFTPQPQANPASSANHTFEVTHISDSMPATATDDASVLKAQLANMAETFQTVRSRYSENESMWEKQQTKHEDLNQEYRLLLGKQKSTEEKLEVATKNNETLRERLASRTTETRTLNEQLDEQRGIHLLSEDAKVTEITKLRKELAQANEEKARALKNTQTVESTLEFLKEQYRIAQEAVSSSRTTITELEAQNAKLAHTASGEVSKLKTLHLDRQHKNLETQVRSLKAENTTLKRTLTQKEEELQRAKLSGGRLGVGTRATSVTPQPAKTRSRAASPMGGRLSSLRNS